MGICFSRSFICTNIAMIAKWSLNKHRKLGESLQQTDGPHSISRVRVQKYCASSAKNGLNYVAGCEIPGKIQSVCPYIGVVLVRKFYDDVRSVRPRGTKQVQGARGCCGEIDHETDSVYSCIWNCDCPGV